MLGDPTTGRRFTRCFLCNSLDTDFDKLTYHCGSRWVLSDDYKHLQFQPEHPAPEPRLQEHTEAV